MLVNRANSLWGACLLFLRAVPLPPWSLRCPAARQGHCSLQKAGSPWDVTGDKERDLPLGGGTGAGALESQPSCESSAVSLQPGTPRYLPLRQPGSRQHFDTQPKR